MGINDPCYGCKRRKVGCHSVCILYIEWAKEIRERNRARFRHKEKEMIGNSYQIDKSRKIAKSK